MDNPSKTDKYHDIIKTGKRLFWKYGIKRVTIEEICKDASVSKMTFYKFFTNKIELAKTILDIVYKESLTEFDQLIHSNISFTEKIKELFIMKLEGTKDISIEFITDIYKKPDLGMQEYMENQRKDSLAIFVDFLKDSQKKGQIRKEIKIEFILHYLNQAMSMVQDEQLVSKYEHPQDLIMEAMNFLFYGLLPHK
ncbi:MAG: hypothetical protein B6I20_10440 [Bacteroidetes bacterium 4572_117]|nr:MAG: hypothetical protein B6I20_10440 [Bacteroidetes bacterium 4572_117]